MIDTLNKVLKVASYTDSLTGLANRSLFNKLSDNVRNLAIRNKTCVAVMFIDLDNFKQVNDLHGHHIGDLVLCKVSAMCNHNIRKNDIVARIGGDEFALCFYGVDNLDYLKELSDKLQNLICSLNSVNGHKINISASMGVVNAVEPKNISIEEMLHQADELMYQAKNTGKGKALLQQC